MCSGIILKSVIVVCILCTHVCIHVRVCLHECVCVCCISMYICVCMEARGIHRCLSWLLSTLSFEIRSPMEPGAR